MVTNNNKATIIRALDSVAGNHRLPDSIVIADNDSKDGTYGFLCNKLGTIPIKLDNGKSTWPPKHETTYKGIPLVILRKKRGTIGQTINMCLNIFGTKTNLFGFLNPSDWYEPNMIERVLRTIDQHRYCSCIVTNCIDHFSDGRIEYNIKKSYDITRMSMKHEYNENMFIPSDSFKRMKVGFNEQLDIMYDYDLMFKLSKIGLIYHIAEFLHHCDIKDQPKAIINQIKQKEIMVRRTNLDQKT